MAIVSISRIQQRRGKANSGTGLPQLASGEIGWAIDTQELYIGNGAVSDGAPYVGNTRILTQHDIGNFNTPSSIFGKLTYVYKSSGAILDYYIINGTGYTDGTYNEVPLNWISNGNQPIAAPIANITVSGGAVTSVILIFQGIGVSNNAVFDDGAYIGGNGDGFLLHVTNVSSLITKAIKRSIQSRLADRVNTSDFGSVGDGIVDDTISLQNAIDQLFYNAPQSVTLTISATLAIGNTVVFCNATTEMVGALVSGTGIPDGATISSVNLGVYFVMTAGATALGTYTLNLTLPPAHNVEYNTAERVVLEIPAGTYRITNTLYIPSYATIVGAGKSSTILYFDPSLSAIGSITNNTKTLNIISADLSMMGASVTGPGIPENTVVTAVNVGVYVTLSNNATSTQTTKVFTILLTADTPVIQCINDLSTISTPGNIEQTTYINQPKNITIKNLQIASRLRSQTNLQLDSVRDSHFENLSITGEWNNTFVEGHAGIKLTALSQLVTCKNNLFKNITIKGFGYGVYSNNDISNNSFIDGSISDVRYGFGLGLSSDGITVGQQDGPVNTKIDRFNFSNVKRHAVQIGLGYTNLIENCDLSNVGNDGGTTIAPIYPQIYFNSYNNIVNNITSDRSKILTLPVVSTLYIPEVAGHVSLNSTGSYKINGLTNSITPVSLFKLPLPTNVSGAISGIVQYTVNYIFTSNTHNYVRSGTFDITLNATTYTVTSEPNYSNLQFVDEYNYTGLEDFNLGINFSAKLLNSSGVTATPGELPSHIMIRYINNLVADAGYMTYSYSYKFL